MIGVDTNVWVRYLTNDDPPQAERALALLERSDEVFVAKTVLLEVEWVLRAVYEVPRPALLAGLMQILGLPNIHAEHPDQIAAAIDFYREGLDFADALHLAAGHVRSFHTFDAALVKRGKALGAAAEQV